MTTNKPEVVAWLYEGTKLGNMFEDEMKEDFWFVPETEEGPRTHIKGQPVVRLSDCEALQAECEKWKRGSEIRDEQNRDLYSIVFELKAECERLRKDAERIEWLEGQTKKSRTGISFDYHRYAEDGYVVNHGYRFMRRHFASGFKDSLRKAIDTAMETSNDNQ